MMKRLFGAVLILIAAAAAARVFWLKEFAEERNYTQMFIYIGVMLAAGITFSQLKRSPSRKTTAPDVLVRTTDSTYEPSSPDFDTRGDALAGWQLRLRSPFGPKRPVSSWIGGVPVAPSDFDWPRRKNGDALHFVAQIDLSDLQPEEESGQRPALPRSGALLIFITERVWSDEPDRPSYKVILLSEEDMARASAVSVPEDLRLLSDVGFWIDVPTFHYCPVDLVPYLDRDKNQKDAPKTHGIEWIDTWGLAAFEAQSVLTALENERNQRKRRADYEEKRDKTGPLKEFQITRMQEDIYMNESDASVHEALKAFLTRAEGEDLMARVDADAFANLVAHRKVLADGMPTNTALRNLLTPNQGAVYGDLTRNHMDRQRGRLVDVPPEFHPFLTRQITAQKQHRLFGLAIPAMTDYPDLRGLDCLLSLDADPLLGTQTEHESGFSIWSDRTEMTQGRFENGRVIWHTNV